MNGLQSLVPAFKKARKKRVPKYASGGAPATSYVSNMPAFAEQPMRNLVQTTEDLIRQPDVQYGGDRTAQFNDLQEQGFEGVKNLGPSAQSTAAGNLAQTIGDRALGTSYNPNTFSNTISGPQQVNAPGGPQQVTAPGGPQQTSTGSFTQPGTTDKYMNPYMQSVVDIGKREATRQDDIARTQRNAAAVGAGAFGGSRQAIVEAEAGRNLGQRLSDIQQQGSDAAFKAAQAQFNAEQGLGLQSQMANQQAGLKAGDQSLTAQQANQAAGLKAGDQSLTAQQANQQAGLTFNQQDLERQKMQEGSRQFGANLGLQGLNAANTAASVLGGAGSDIFGQNLKTTGAQLAAGGAEQEQAQRVLDQQYADFQRQEQDPYRRLSFMSDILHGTQGSVKTTFDTPAQPSNMQTLAGLGSIFAGLSKAEGGSIKKLSAIDRGLARIAPDSVGEFENGGIIGFAAGSDKYGVPYGPEEEEEGYEGAPSHNLPAGLVTGKFVWDKAAGKWKRIGERAAVQHHLGMQHPSTSPEVAKTYKIAREAKLAEEAAAAAAAARGPGLTSIAPPGAGSVIREGAGDVARTGVKWAGRALKPLALGIAGYETYNMTPEQREEQLWMKPDPQRGPVKKAATAAGSYAYNLGNDLLFGLPDYLRDRKPGPTQANAAVAKTDETTVPEVKEEPGGGGKGGLYSLVGGPRVKAERGPTMDEIKAAGKDAGINYDELEQKALTSGAAIDAAKKANAVQTQAEMDALYEKQGVLGADREKKLQGRLDEMGARGKQNEKDAYINAGLAILMAPPGGKGWRGAIAPIAAGAGLGLKQLRAGEKELRAEKEKLDDSMDALADARRQESFARGKDKIAMGEKVRGLETEAKERVYNITNTFGLKKADLGVDFFKTFELTQAQERQQRLQASTSNAEISARLGIASLAYGPDGKSGGAGSKMLKPGTAAFDTAVRNEANAIEKSGMLVGPDGSPVTDPVMRRQLARQQAEANVMRRGPTAPEGVRLRITD